MRRALPRLACSERCLRVAASLDATWDVVAAAPPEGAPGGARAGGARAGGSPTRWYADAAPLLFRSALDRVARGVLGDPPVPAVVGLRSAPAGLLGAGDEAGLWRVVEADHEVRRLRLQAVVHAPGSVRATAWLTPVFDGCRVHLRIGMRPSGLVGAAYRLVDLPAREVVVEGVARALLADLRRAGLPVE